MEPDHPMLFSLLRVQYTRRITKNPFPPYFLGKITFELRRLHRFSGIFGSQ